MRALICVLLLACKSESIETTTTPPSATANPAVSASATVSAAPSASVAVKPPTVDEELLWLTQMWNDMLSRHSAAALDHVYALNVTMYGTSYTRAAAIGAKQSALVSDYTQSIASLMVVKGDPDKPRVIFEKTWTVKGKTSHVRASLGFVKENGRWAVADETDAKTEDMLASQSCLGLVHAAVLSTDDGKTYRGKGYGTMYVCGPPDCDTFQIAGIHLDENGMQRMASFDVDQKKGVVAHAGLELKADPAIALRMKAACAKEARASGAP